MLTSIIHEMGVFESLLTFASSPLMTDDSLTPNPSLANVPQNSSQPQQLLSPTSLTGSQAQFSTGVPSPDRRSPRMPSPQPSNMSSNPSFKTAHSTLTPSASVLAPPKNFSYLQRPEIYHPLTLLDIPPPFRIPASQPDPTTPLATLLETGHFRSAAITAATLLASSNIAPSDHVQILNLLYTRLSCLTLCGQTSFAAQEVKALEDLNSAYYRDPETGVHLVLWELRVLAVRLQGMGFNDPRRGVMGYYDLAREARFSLTNLKKLEGEKEEEAITLWTERLEDLGIRVASALIEMDDLEGATKHLQSLRLSPNSTLGFQKALLWLFLGDIEAAKGCVSQSSGTENEKIIQAISYISDNEPAASIPIWEDLISSAAESSSAIPLYRQNLAVCYLYLGELASVCYHHLMFSHLITA